MKKKMAGFKRGVLLGVLVVALGLAVYCNWSLGERQNAPTATDAAGGSLPGQAVYVNAGAASAPAADDYFTKTRAEREEAREKATAALKKIAENVKSDPEAAKNAAEQAAAIARSRETESNIEALVRAKGFAECVAVLGEKNVSVVVKTDGLLASDTLQIQEIVQQASGISPENITIIEAK